MLTAPSVESDVDGAASAEASLSERTRHQWLLVFRTITITILLLTTAGLRISRGEALIGRIAFLFYGACAFTYVSVLVAALIVRGTTRPRNEAPGRTAEHKGRVLRAVTVFQILTDGLVATILVLMTGGAESAFTFLFSIAVFNAAVFLGVRDTMAIAAYSSALFVGAAAIHIYHWLPFFALSDTGWLESAPSVVANVLAFFTIAYLATLLSKQLTAAADSLSETKARLVDVEHNHEQVLQSLPSGVLTLGQDQDAFFINSAGKAILADDDNSSESLEAIFRDLITRKGRFEFQLASGRVIGGSAAPLRTDSPETGQVVVFQDLTELRELQQEVTRADRLRALGGFSAGLAHELRNPLASITGCLSMVQDDITSTTLTPQAKEDTVKMLGIARREAERLAGLVTSFLTYAQPSPPSLVDVELNAVCKQVIDAVGLSGSDCDISLSGPPTRVSTDPQHLTQIIWNLVSNAVQAVSRTPAPGKIEISVGHSSTEGIGFIHIDDNGPGIPPGDREKIFVPFFTTRSEGTGLGLATVHQLVSTLGGTIGFQPSTLGGTAFRVKLPSETKVGDG